ncbi:unnamed protein product [Nippostrongylus brasiliensis]|uniref:Fibronectin type-III domain-containing protein n=1 Tax=Nippostrongylus brasiliensis TaxID=27835 RepID=A0A0N4XTJ0_NIPBR|nr:unnamed protein product [Nippostrongylus brasiliensis]
MSIRSVVLIGKSRRQTKPRPQLDAEKRLQQKQRFQKLRNSRLRVAHSTIVSKEVKEAAAFANDEDVVPSVSMVLESDISSADVFDAIINKAPGPLDIPVMRGIAQLHAGNSQNVLPSTTTTVRPMILDVTLPFSTTAWFLSKISTLVGPPINVRVEATSNSSAVVQWDFENGQVDGFVVKYMHEPGGRSDTERWTARTVMSPTSRHLEVPHLTAHKPYALTAELSMTVAVVGMIDSRQGACSDPPTLLERLTPTYMVQNLVVEWKTSNSVKLRWDYNGPVHVGFYLNHTGKKEYFDHTLAMKSMTTPGFKHELDEGSREYL